MSALGQKQTLFMSAQNVRFREQSGPKSTLRRPPPTAVPYQSKPYLRPPLTFREDANTSPNASPSAYLETGQ